MHGRNWQSRAQARPRQGVGAGMGTAGEIVGAVQSRGRAGCAGAGTRACGHGGERGRAAWKKKASKWDRLVSERKENNLIPEFLKKVEGLRIFLNI